MVCRTYTTFKNLELVLYFLMNFSRNTKSHKWDGNIQPLYIANMLLWMPNIAYNSSKYNIWWPILDAWIQCCEIDFLVFQTSILLHVVGDDQRTRRRCNDSWRAFRQWPALRFQHPRYHAAHTRALANHVTSSTIPSPWGNVFTPPKNVRVFSVVCQARSIN